MSGGIDSSVSAMRLAAQDFDLSAVFMRNWDTRDEYAADTGCEWERDWEDVELVCRAFGISCQMIDLSKEHWTRVFEPALRDWEHGSTLNPEVWCNREIKFGALLERLPYKNAWLATGHYARKEWAVGRPRLLRGADSAKDYLSSITQAGLARALFPLATSPNRPCSSARSMRVCFVGEKKRTDFKAFIAGYIAPSPGPVKLLASGRTLMEHGGLWSFIVGEKLRLRGMPEKIGFHVLTKRTATPRCTARAREFAWVWADDPPSGLEAKGGVELDVQVRHRMGAVRCIARSAKGGGVEATFAEPLKGVAPGQVAALWDGEWCLGGCGVITAVE
ncbi:tRNA-specific 2-thiouridylase [Mycena latifolia]|nr:tRNA-specific 2-thiouridylase [Mycena latifolia]